MEQEIIIRLEHVSKTYKLYEKPIDRMKEALSITKKKYHKIHYALKDITFDVKKGETVGIIGVNGAGKSTLLKLISGVTTPTEGTITVNGKVSALLELGTGFNPEYTGLENIFLNGTMMGYTKEEMNQKLESIVQFADIGDFISQPVKTYSTGMFSRLAFAVAISVEPEILIVDEVLSVGDIFFQNKCFHKIEELKKKGVTILFVSHDLDSVKQICENVLWIDQGIQKMYGSKEEVCTQYINEKIKNINYLSEMIPKDISSMKFYINQPDTYVRFPKIKIAYDSVMSNDIEIKSFFILDKNSQITTQLKAGQAYSAHIISESHVSLSDLIFGFVAENHKGIVILGINTYMGSHGKTIDTEKDRLCEVIFEFVLPKLQKGEYLLSPAVARGTQDNHEILTWIHNALLISISNEGYNISLLEIDHNTKINVYDQSRAVFY